MRVTQDLYQMYKKNRFFKRWQWGEGENEWVSERVSVGGVMALKWKTQKEKGKRYSPISGDDFAGQPSKHFKIENVNWAWWEKEREEEKEKRVWGGGWRESELLNLKLYTETPWHTDISFTSPLLSSQSHLFNSLTPPFSSFLCSPHHFCLFSLAWFLIPDGLLILRISRG